MIKRVTSFMHHTTGEGERISFTYSLIKDDGTVDQDNIKASFVILDEDIKKKISEIRSFIEGKLPE